MLLLAQQETEYGKYRVNDFGQLMAHRIRSEGLEKIDNMDALLGMINIANAQSALH